MLFDLFNFFKTRYWLVVNCQLSSKIHLTFLDFSVNLYFYCSVFTYIPE